MSDENDITADWLIEQLLKRIREMDPDTRAEFDRAYMRVRDAIAAGPHSADWDTMWRKPFDHRGDQ